MSRESRESQKINQASVQSKVVQTESRVGAVENLAVGSLTSEMGNRYNGKQRGVV